jgi:hypothetical protein
MDSKNIPLSRRDFLNAAGVLFSTVVIRPLPAPRATDDWRTLLPDYEASTRGNIIHVDGRAALLSAKVYPGTYVRDALSWGPLALKDPALGLDCYQWFAETQFESGQIRSAVPLFPEDEGQLEPKDDEGTLLFVIASDWLQRSGYTLDPDRIVRAYDWVDSHVSDHTYISPAGPVRYWADTVAPDTPEAIAHNQGLLTLARRAMVNMGLGDVQESDAAAARAQYQSFYNGAYLTLGKYSNFAPAQDVSAIFPEFISRYLYGEPMLTDVMVVNHVKRIVSNAAVYYWNGRLAGLKVVSGSEGDFLPRNWFFAADINPPGDYQNGGHWPLYTIAALALAYSITGDESYATLIGQLVEGELGVDHQSKEVISLAPGKVGMCPPERMNYTWNALIPVACQWCGLV